MSETKALCDTIRETSFSIHCYLKNGFLEKVYENALFNRLLKEGIKVEKQVSLSVQDEDGTVIGEYFADLLVEDSIIIEIKACKNLAEEHFAQIFGYLRASKKKHGVLINFGAEKLQIRKIVL